MISPWNSNNIAESRFHSHLSFKRCSKLCFQHLAEFSIEWITRDMAKIDIFLSLTFIVILISIPCGPSLSPRIKLKANLQWAIWSAQEKKISLLCPPIFIIYIWNCPALTHTHTITPISHQFHHPDDLIMYLLTQQNEHAFETSKFLSLCFASSIDRMNAKSSFDSHCIGTLRQSHLLVAHFDCQEIDQRIVWNFLPLLIPMDILTHSNYGCPNVYSQSRPRFPLYDLQCHQSIVYRVSTQFWH